MELPKLGQPAQRALASIGIKTLEDVTKFSKKEISALHGLGPSTIKILTKVFAEHGLKFKE